MTWKEVKEAFEKAGVKDSDEIAYIDINAFDHNNFELTQEKEREWRIWS